MGSSTWSHHVTLIVSGTCGVKVDAMNALSASDIDPSIILSLFTFTAQCRLVFAERLAAIVHRGKRPSSKVDTIADAIVELSLNNFGIVL